MITGQRILITGASHGLGLELAALFTAQDNEIIAISKHQHDSIRFPKTTSKSLDIADKEAVRKVLAELTEAGMLPDIVIFNAAIHLPDNDPFIDFQRFSDVIDVNMMSVFNFLACLMPALSKPVTFVFCSSGAIIFPNPAYHGYYLSKLAVTKTFDHFADRYARLGFRFKSVVLGPMHSRMLDDSQPPAGIVRFLRDATTGNYKDAAAKISRFIEKPGKRMYCGKASACILWLGRIAQRLLPRALKFYQAPKSAGRGKPRSKPQAG